MGPTPGHFPTSSEPDARFEAIVARGERLRRRERAGRRAITGGAAAAVVIVVLALAGLLPSGHQDRGPVAAGGSSTSSSTTTVPAPPDALTVHATPGEGSLEVRVQDPEFPSTDTAALCVSVRVQPEAPAQVATAAAEACWNPAAGDATTVAAVPIVTTELDCAVAVKPDAVASTVVPTTSDVHHAFLFTMPEGMAPGSYVAEVRARSNADGTCATVTPGSAERSASTSVALRHP